MTVFTLDEANAMIPELRRLIKRAQVELHDGYGQLKLANSALLDQEWKVRQARIDGITDETDSETLQAGWQQAADHLQEQKKGFAEVRDAWVTTIGDRGVILRDLQRGLLDFPALLGSAEFFYCWVVDEDEITHWHSRQEGYGNRKPLDQLHNWDGDGEDTEEA